MIDAEELPDVEFALVTVDRLVENVKWEMIHELRKKCWPQEPVEKATKKPTTPRKRGRLVKNEQRETVTLSELDCQVHRICGGRVFGELPMVCGRGNSRMLKATNLYLGANRVGLPIIRLYASSFLHGNQVAISLIRMINKDEPP